MKLDHYTLYEPIPDVAVYESGRRCPDPVALQVLGLPGTETPVGLSALDGRLHALTIEQSAALRAQLERAEQDAAQSRAQPPLIATGTEGRCESCSQPVLAGEPIVIDDVDTEDRVVLHAGPCPCAEQERAPVVAERSN